MISSFFAKTKPINYVVLLVFMGLFYCALLFFWERDVLGFKEIWLAIFTLAILFLSVLVINELVRQNKVTALSSFAMLFFVALTIAFPQTLLDENAVLANFFILLAIKKLLEVKEAKNAKHKIFDATLLICVASIFYKWSFVYMGAIVFAINTFESKNFKTWLVLLLGMATFFLLLWVVLIPFDNVGFLQTHYSFFTLEIDIEAILRKLGAKDIVFFAVVLLLAMIDFFKLRKKGGGRLIMIRNMLLFFTLAVILIFLESEEASPLLLSFFPAAVFMTNFIETIGKKGLKELSVNLFILTAFMVFLLENLV